MSDLWQDCLFLSLHLIITQQLLNRDNFIINCIHEFRQTYRVDFWAAEQWVANQLASQNIKEEEFDVDAMKVLCSVFQMNYFNHDAIKALKWLCRRIG